MRGLGAILLLCLLSSFALPADPFATDPFKVAAREPAKAACPCGGKCGPCRCTYPGECLAGSFCWVESESVTALFKGEVQIGALLPSGRYRPYDARQDRWGAYSEPPTPRPAQPASQPVQLSLPSYQAPYYQPVYQNFSPFQGATRSAGVSGRSGGC